ncbi:uncharacterized protein [Chelonus insularis]|uniref:uncharacterized protein n=1 Tax=Chelonus insularis TaxID=460826 RepID=UPI00158A0BAF|nr:uncharacterized protein LOC118071783 [Chelonus insularis]
MRKLLLFSFYIKINIQRDVNNINHAFRSVIMKTYMLAGLTIILQSITFIYEVRVFAIFRAGFTVISCLLGTYIYHGAADDLYMMSQSIAVILCSLEWNDELMKMRRTLLIMICRAQKPLVISLLDGLMLALTRKIYASFLSYLISYIMTLRAIVSSH